MRFYQALYIIDQHLDLELETGGDSRFSRLQV